MNDIQTWLDKIQQTGRNLTVWEEDFMERIIDKFALYGNVTKGEARIIEKIYADRTPN